MPITKFNPGKYDNQKAVEYVINYICSPQKTLHSIIGALGAYPIRPQNIIRQFKAIQVFHRNTKGRKIYHLEIAFSPEEIAQLDITDYENMGYLIIEYFWVDGHQAVFGLHEDSGKLHIHVAVNSVNFRTGRKYHLQRSNYKQIRKYIQTVVDSRLRV